MSHDTPAVFAPVAQRWATFVDKVRARMAEIFKEADQAYQDVYAVDVIDGVAMSGVSSALKARLQQLSSKVGDSFDTIDQEIDKLGDEHDLDGHVVARFSATQRRLGEQLKREIEHQTEDFIVRHEADRERLVAARAAEEIKVPLPCNRCGAPLQRTIHHVPINITCPHCGSVTTSTPGSASACYGAIARAFEAALPAWHALQDAEDAWHLLRHKTEDDLERFRAATRAYWTAFAAARGNYEPGWTGNEVQAEIVGKMGHFETYTATSDQQPRAAMTAGIAAVWSGDVARVQQWLRSQRDAGSSAEDLLYALAERNCWDQVRWLLPYAHAVVEPGDSLAEWGNEKLQELSQDIFTRS
jgi:hypothetical protein